jgi:hypothetical protein
MPKRSAQSRAVHGYAYKHPSTKSLPSGILIQARSTLSGHIAVNLELPTTPGECAAVADELGIPPTALFYTMTLDPPQGWPDYILEVIGTHATPTDPPEAPEWRDYLLTPYPTFTLIRPWRRRVRHHESPLFFEALWSPQHPVSLTIHGVETDIPLIKDALTLLAGTRGAGRRRGSRFWTRETFRAAWPEKVAEAQRQRHGQPLRQEELARAYGISQPTLTRYLREYGRPTP